MAIDVALDLSTVVLLFGALVLAWLAYMIASGIRYLIGYIPLAGPAIADGVEAAIVSPAKGLAESLEKRIVNGLSQLVDDVAVLVAIPLLLAHGVYKGLDYLWNDATKGLVKAVSGSASAVAHKALKLANTAETDATKAYNYADKIVTAKLPAAITHLEAYADNAAATALHAAEGYADSAVSTLKGAEDAAIATALSIAKTAESDVAGAVSTAEAYAGTLVAPVGAGLTELENYINGLGLAGIIAAVPALSALLTQVLTDTGLTNSDCRSKVKGICATDPNAWAGLLAGIAAVGIAFDFKDFCSLLQELEQPVEALVRQAA